MTQTFRELAGSTGFEGAIFIAGGARWGLQSLLIAIGALRKLPRLTATSYSLKLENGYGTREITWDSIGPLAVKTLLTVRSTRIRVATAKIRRSAIGRARNFILPDRFETPIDEIVTELNAIRARATGDTTSAIAPEQPAIGLAKFRFPWLTFTLLAALIIVFALENMLPVTPGGKNLSPSSATLVAFGAPIHNLVLSKSEWYRVFTAALLHVNFAHILQNCIGLVLGGWLLERLVGRLWFFATLCVGALCGSLVSLAVNPNGGVGASDALMAVFAALLVCSFRYAAGAAPRRILQVISIPVLVASQLPIASTSTAGHVDYAGHIGGALSGAMLALLLLRFWPENERIPQLRKAAVAISAIGALVFLVSGGLAVANYSKYDIELIPPSEMPKTFQDQRSKAGALVARYPKDPRAHLFLAQSLIASKDNAKAEQELRLALEWLQAHPDFFQPWFELEMRARLAGLLLDEGKQEEAKKIALPDCSELKRAVASTALFKLLVSQHLCGQPSDASQH